jgi:hypothetical protein
MLSATSASLTCRAMGSATARHARLFAGFAFLLRQRPHGRDGGLGEALSAKIIQGGVRVFDGVV